MAKSFQKCGEVGGGEFIPEFVSGYQTQASFGGANDIVIIPPSGQRVLLTGLIGFSAITLVNIDFGSRNVIVDKTLESGTTNAIDEFVVSTGDTAGVIFQILGEIDETLRIFKVSGTGTTVAYGYMLGE